MVKRWPDLSFHNSKVDFGADLPNLFEILQFRICRICRSAFADEGDWTFGVLNRRMQRAGQLVYVFPPVSRTRFQQGMA